MNSYLLLLKLPGPLNESDWRLDPYTEDVPSDPCGPAAVDRVDATEAYLRYAIELRRRGMHELVLDLEMYLHNLGTAAEMLFDNRDTLSPFSRVAFALTLTSTQHELVEQVVFTHGTHTYRVVILRGSVHSLSRMP